MITLIFGPMYSGKTTEMLRLLERSYIAGRTVVLLRPNLDTRTFLSHTPRDVRWANEQFVDLGGFDADKYDVIGIDEGQMHVGLAKFCAEQSAFGKNVIVSALHSTSELEMFQPIIDIIPYCENIIKLNAICTQCHSEHGSFTHYLKGKKTDKVAVGGMDEYTVLCAKCYSYEMNKG